MLKDCLRGKRALGSACPISGFPVFSPAVREETPLKVPAVLLLARLSELGTALGGSVQAFGVWELLQRLLWAGGREHWNSHSWRGLQAPVFGLLFVLLFLLNWLRKANTLSSVSVGAVCASNSEHPQSGAPACK